MAVYDLYGFLPDDLDRARYLLEDFIGIQFAARDSEYQGAYFQWGKTNGEHFVLKRNVDPIDGEASEMSFSEYKILFYVNDSLRSRDLQAKMTQDFILLRHEDLE